MGEEVGEEEEGQHQVLGEEVGVVEGVGVEHLVLEVEEGVEEQNQVLVEVVLVLCHP